MHCPKTTWAQHVPLCRRACRRGQRARWGIAVSPRKRPISSLRRRSARLPSDTSGASCWWLHHGRLFLANRVPFGLMRVRQRACLPPLADLQKTLRSGACLIGYICTGMRATSSNRALSSNGKTLLTEPPLLLLTCHDGHRAPPLRGCVTKTARFAPADAVLYRPPRLPRHRHRHRQISACRRAPAANDTFKASMKRANSPPEAIWQSARACRIGRGDETNLSMPCAAPSSSDALNQGRKFAAIKSRGRHRIDHFIKTTGGF